jgi:hypothetical protein
MGCSGLGYRVGVIRADGEKSGALWEIKMKWKYYIEEIRFGEPIKALEDQLNHLGRGGWEVAAAFPSPTPDAHGHVFVLLKQPTKSK